MPLVDLSMAEHRYDAVSEARRGYRQDAPRPALFEIHLSMDCMSRGLRNSNFAAKSWFKLDAPMARRVKTRLAPSVQAVCIGSFRRNVLPNGSISSMHVPTSSVEMPGLR
jgi:hypothetical protein